MDKLNLNSKIVLNNGVKMPVIGLGTYLSDNEEGVVNAVKWALQAGYRLIVTAATYENEEGVGKGIMESGIPREEIFITTKLWNTDQGYESTLKAIDTSLAKLGLEYVDLYLIHWPTADNEGKISINKREETWKAMEEIYKSGKAKAIGVSNYKIKHLEEMKKYATVMPTVDQVEFHPYLNQKALLAYCQENKINLTAYSPLGRGQILSDKTITEIAKVHNKSRAQVCLGWLIQKEIIVIPKASSEHHLKSNMEIFDFSFRVVTTTLTFIPEVYHRLAIFPTCLPQSQILPSQPPYK